MWFQNFTTNEPDDSMLEVAIEALTLVLPERIGKCRLEKIDISMLEDAFRRGLAMAEALA